jgi:hypothetical protein
MEISSESLTCVAVSSRKRTDISFGVAESFLDARIGSFERSQNFRDGASGDGDNLKLVRELPQWCGDTYVRHSLSIF